jgi:hypothetical protein
MGETFALAINYMLGRITESRNFFGKFCPVHPFTEAITVDTSLKTGSNFR